MFSKLGPPGQLRLHLVDQGEVTASNAYVGTERGPCSLRLPLVLTLAENDSRETFSDNGRKLSKLCSRMHHNISSWKLDEYIFKCDPPAPESIFAGPRSVQTFRRNLYLRLAEVFCNMKLLLNQQPNDFSVPEFEAYEHLYKDLLKCRNDMPTDLGRFHEELRQLVNKIPR